MYVPALVGLHFLLDLLNIPVGHGDLAPRKKEGIKKKKECLSSGFIITNVRLCDVGACDDWPQNATFA